MHLLFNAQLDYEINELGEKSLISSYLSLRGGIVISFYVSYARRSISYYKKKKVKILELQLFVWKKKRT